uniref:Uncharacterized protein n=1 Tax=Chromera velia CCMP2878 TaxID=1169474 RepID=A0A0G4FKY8_9ALVE|eukprot:Cvel_17550.t1-p1 / transcript=Cvel_17550.t1 / gene=Cvel_17550 / organism=Chromera_velia_CCMP2878 / gene_product=hypothetical protein / transcript_product=hypothetical protein / location=Cvel_scaffold1409:6601-9859(-) / protein_length=716 / sequence_SO=supercontig / SO=protein_coding / is_pseudo=false
MRWQVRMLATYDWFRAEFKMYFYMVFIPTAVAAVFFSTLFLSPREPPDCTNCKRNPWNNDVWREKLFKALKKAYMAFKPPENNANKEKEERPPPGWTVNGVKTPPRPQRDSPKNGETNQVSPTLEESEGDVQEPITKDQDQLHTPKRNTPSDQHETPQKTTVPPHTPSTNANRAGPQAPSTSQTFAPTPQPHTAPTPSQARGQPPPTTEAHRPPSHPQRIPPPHTQTGLPPSQAQQVPPPAQKPLIPPPPAQQVSQPPHAPFTMPPTQAQQVAPPAQTPLIPPPQAQQVSQPVHAPFTMPPTQAQQVAPPAQTPLIPPPHAQQVSQPPHAPFTMPPTQAQQVPPSAQTPLIPPPHAQQVSQPVHAPFTMPPTQAQQVAPPAQTPLIPPPQAEQVSQPVYPPYIMPPTAAQRAAPPLPPVPRAPQGLFPVRDSISRPRSFLNKQAKPYREMSEEEKLDRDIARLEFLMGGLEGLLEEQKQRNEVVMEVARSTQAWRERTWKECLASQLIPDPPEPSRSSKHASSERRRRRSSRRSKPTEEGQREVTHREREKDREREKTRHSRHRESSRSRAARHTEKDRDHTRGAHATTTHHHTTTTTSRRPPPRSSSPPEGAPDTTATFLEHLTEFQKGTERAMEKEEYTTARKTMTAMVKDLSAARAKAGMLKLPPRVLNLQPGQLLAGASTGGQSATARVGMRVRGEGETGGSGNVEVPFCGV